MEAVKVVEAAPCRCGGQAKIFGPSEFAPHSHWGVYCSKDRCDNMAVAATLEEAIEDWNISLTPFHP